MKMSLLGGLLAVMACATGGAGNEDLGPATKHVVYGDSGSGSTAPGSGPVTWYDIRSPALTTWQYLPIAYSGLGLTITKYDSTTSVIEGERLRSRADFVGKPLSAILNCGNVARVPADTQYDVNIHVRTALRGTDTTSSFANTVTASARSSTVSGDPVACSIGATIPDRIAAAVTSAIAEGTKVQ
jgi:hypothetical protein